VAVTTVTYHDHTAGAVPDGTEEVPLWQSSAAKKLLLASFKRLRVNPTPVSITTGTTQGTATALSNSYDYHLISTVSAGGGTKFAALASDEIGERKIVRCSGASPNNLIHYPVLGGKFNDQSVNVGVTIEKGASVEFIAVSITDWVTIP
jgi:hypothetical protein